MKKKLAILALSLCLGASMASCGTDGGNKDTKTEDNADKEETAKADDYNLEEAVKLGEYKGISVEKVISAVTDEAVQSEIDYALSNPVEVQDENAVVQEGDTVNIDYEGTKDGVAFDGGTAEDFDLTIGSGRFIEGFEDGLIGAKNGEVRDLNLTFPEDYKEESLQGADVVFHVTVNMIKRPATELTDAWVQQNGGGEYQTADEYRAGMRAQLEQNSRDQAEQQVKLTAWSQVVNGSEILEYPKSLVSEGEEAYDQQNTMYAQMLGMELEEYIEQSGVTQEEYDEMKSEYGKSVASAKLVLQAIVKEEGFTADDEDYKTRLAEYAGQQQMTEDEFVEQYGADTVEEQIMMDRVIGLIMENAVITETQESAEDASGETGEDAQAEESGGEAAE